MDNLLNNPPNISILLCEIQIPQSSWILVMVGVRAENSTRLSLGSDDSLDPSVSLHPPRPAATERKRGAGKRGRGWTYTHVAVVVSTLDIAAN